MDKEVEKIINEAVMEIIEKSNSPNKIKKLKDIHFIKIHFIPKRYRVLGGILQSMNIQFGNFIEILMTMLIKNEDKYIILDDYSGKKSNSFVLSQYNEKLIDEYITLCQTDEVDTKTEFPLLINDIINNINEDKKEDKINKFKHDIDLLFKDKESNIIYYLEIKYNDDHDTGKFVDINRKFIKTYAYLAKELNISNSEELVPILFFFNNKKLKGNIYVPEGINIKRGEKFFKEFLTIDYNNIDSYMKSLSESEEITNMFHDLYQNVMELN